MDRVRFGRALGYGARHAARALKDAAEAAASSDSAPAKQTPRPGIQTSPAQVITRARTQTTRAATASRSMFAPLKEFSSTVLLQVMGTIFGLFTLVMSHAAWRLRTAFHPPYSSPDAQHLYLASGMALLFLWFTVSSFVRANRIGRR